MFEDEKYALVANLRSTLMTKALESRPRGVGEPNCVSFFDHIDESESARIKTRGKL